MTSTPSSGGTIRIVDADDVYEAESELLDGDITIDISEGDAATVASDGRGETGAPSGPFDAARVADAAGGPTNTLLEVPGGPWLAVLPAATTLVGVGAAVALGPAVWSVETSVLPETAVRLGHVTWFLTALAGTLWLWTDAERASADGDAWTPNPAAYVVAGAVALGCTGTAYFALGGHPTTTLAAAFLGMVLVGLPTASVVAGPVYLFVRHRRGGASDGAASDGAGGR